MNFVLLLFPITILLQTVVGWIAFTTQTESSEPATWQRIDIDKNGDIIVCGTFHADVVKVFNSAGKPVKQYDGPVMALIGKYSSDGDILWMNSLPFYYNLVDAKIALDSDGNIVSFGRFTTGPVQIQSSSGSTVTIPSARNNQETCFLVKFDTDGNILFVIRFVSGGVYIMDIDIEDGDIHVNVGYSSYLEIFDVSNSNVPKLKIDMEYMRVLLKFSSNGHLLWQTKLDGGYDLYSSLNQDSIYLAGEFVRKITLESSSISRNKTTIELIDETYREDLYSETGWFISSYTRDGTLKWAIKLKIFLHSNSMPYFYLSSNNDGMLICAIGASTQVKIYDSRNNLAKIIDSRRRGINLIWFNSFGYYQFHKTIYTLEDIEESLSARIRFDPSRNLLTIQMKTRFKEMQISDSRNISTVSVNRKNERVGGMCLIISSDGTQVDKLFEITNQRISGDFVLDKWNRYLLTGVTIEGLDLVEIFDHNNEVLLNMKPITNQADESNAYLAVLQSTVRSSTVAMIKSIEETYPLIKPTLTNQKTQNNESGESTFTFVWIIVLLIGLAVIANTLLILKFVSKWRAKRKKQANGSSKVNSVTTTYMNNVTSSSVMKTGDSTVTGFTTYTSFSSSSGTTLIGNPGLSIPAFLSYQFSTDFRLQQKIATGGSGTVHLASTTHPDLSKHGKTIVVKEFRAMNSQTSKDAFFQELSIMYMLKEHENIAKVLGFCEHPYCIIMKHYPIGSLSNFLIGNSKKADQRQELTKRMKVRFIKNICEGLGFMANNGLAHCDIKTANILLDQNSAKNNELICVLTDFGISTLINSKSLTVDQFRVIRLNALSKLFASPELLAAFSRLTDYTFESLPETNDVYATACVLYEILTRKTIWALKW